MLKILLIMLTLSFLFANLSPGLYSNNKIYNSYLATTTDSILIENQSFIVLFESNRHMTDTFPDQKIEKLKSILEQYPAFSIRLEARTDSVGSRQYNLALADRRLDFVRNELIKSGIEEDRFIEFVFGEEEPLADNNSPEGRQANRSVRVVAGLYSPVRMISGRFVSDEDGSGLGGILYTESRHHNAFYKIDSSGNFSFPVPEVDSLFSIEFFSNKDHIMRKTFYNLNKLSHSSFITIPLKALQIGETISFPDIFFLGARTAIDTIVSKQAPNRLFNLIDLLENYRFEIQGHSNFPRVERFKDCKLANARARTIYDHLLEQGVDSSRLEWKGYGNWYMIFPNPQSYAQGRQNRRVSVKVLGRIDD